MPAGRRSAEGMRRRRRLPEIRDRITEIRSAASGVVETGGAITPSTISDLCPLISVLWNSRKEVIQPQVPLRLPCYDFTPVADLTVVGCLPGLPRGWRAALR